MTALLRAGFHVHHRGHGLALLKRGAKIVLVPSVEIVTEQMFDAIAPRYDLVNRLMTFRLDVRWRRIAVRSLALSPRSLVADLASGTGDLCVELARQHLRPLSVDLSFGMLHADRSGAPRMQADILRLPFPDGAVDGATCGFDLRNLVEFLATQK